MNLIPELQVDGFLAKLKAAWKFWSVQLPVIESALVTFWLTAPEGWKEPILARFNSTSDFAFWVAVAYFAARGAGIVARVLKQAPKEAA